MAGNQGLNDLTWDGATGASIVLGTTRVLFQKLSPGKVSVKTDKPQTVGEGLPRKRTPGKGELADFNGEMLATDFEEQILPRLPLHGGTLVTFPILITFRHTSIKGSLGIIFDETRIVGLEGPEVTGDEKAVVYKIDFSAMRRYDKGRDGKWKGLAYDTRRASSAAKALMQF